MQLFIEPDTVTSENKWMSFVVGLSSYFEVFSKWKQGFLQWNQYVLLRYFWLTNKDAQNCFYNWRIHGQEDKIFV